MAKKLEFKKVSNELNIFELKENEQRTFELLTPFLSFKGKDGEFTLHEVVDIETGEHGHIFNPHIIASLVNRATDELTRTEGAKKVYLQITFKGKVPHGKKTINTFDCAYAIE